MKIQGSSVGNGMQGIDAAKSREAEATGSSGAGKAGAEALDAAASKINLSSRAQQMQKAKELALAAPDVNEARVAQLQKMIDDGSYRVDAEAVADRLVDSHLMFPE